MADDYMEQELAERISKINSAAFINLRMHNLWLEVNKAACNGLHSKWNAYLERIWCELVGDTDEETEKYFDSFNEELSRLGGFPKTEVNTFDELDPKKISMIQKRYSVLMKKEKFLRKLVNKQGKGTAYRDPVEDYMD